MKILDIDVDVLFRHFPNRKPSQTPIYDNSVYEYEDTLILEPEVLADIVNRYKKTAAKIHFITDHADMYHIYQHVKNRVLDITHIDAHPDFYKTEGIDASLQYPYQIVNCANYLLAMTPIIREVKWGFADPHSYHELKSCSKDFIENRLTAIGLLHHLIFEVKYDHIVICMSPDFLYADCDGYAQEFYRLIGSKLKVPHYTLHSRTKIRPTHNYKFPKLNWSK